MSVLAIGFVLLECKPAIPLRPQFVYVANFASNNVSGFSIGSNGVLTPVPGSPFAGGYNPYTLAVDPKARFVYVANKPSGNVAAYSVGSNGTLTLVPASQARRSGHYPTASFVSRRN